MLIIIVIIGMGSKAHLMKRRVVNTDYVICLNDDGFSMTTGENETAAGTRAKGPAAELPDSRPVVQAMMSWATSPLMSVRRKSRPE